MAGARAAAKAVTRDRISKVATRLFVARGFDAVTVADIARESGVSKVTVFSHFGRKEDLAIDRAEEARSLVASALSDRAEGESAVAAMERLALSLAQQRHVFSGIRPESDPFIAMVLGSPALRQRARELVDELEGFVSQLLIDEGTGERDAQLTAALLLAAYRAVYARSYVSARGGASASVVARDHEADIRRAFAAVRAATEALED